MALVTDKFIFLHIPKTGGTYVRRVLESLYISGVELDSHHGGFPGILNHIQLSDILYRTVICFIRHPLTWYQSRWAFRLCSETGWQGNNLDFVCASNDFNIFVNNCLDYTGIDKGWASKKMDGFIDNIPKELKTFIGKQESLDKDLNSALCQCKAIGSKTDIQPLPRLNMSINDYKPAHVLAKYDYKTYERVLKADGDFIKRYYADLVIDHNILF